MKLYIPVILFAVVLCSCQTKRIATSEQNIRLSKIYIKIDKSTGLNDVSGAKKKIIAIRHRALQGYSFSRLATDESHERRTGSRGGDMGWFRPIDLLPRNVKKVVWALKVNEVSPVIAVKDGFAIYTVTDRKRTK